MNTEGSSPSAEFYERLRERLNELVAAREQAVEASFYESARDTAQAEIAGLRLALQEAERLWRDHADAG